MAVFRRFWSSARDLIPSSPAATTLSMNASILGLTDEQIQERFPLIEEFAEIGDFIDQPVKTYSSGMLMRLAFSIAVHIDPQVLIVDEALSVGDIYFTQRCLRYLHRLRERGITMVIVSHSAGELKALCTHSMWIEHGRIQEIGETDHVIAKYLAQTTRSRSTPGQTAAIAPVLLNPAASWIDGQGGHLRPATELIDDRDIGMGTKRRRSLRRRLARLGRECVKNRAKPGDEIVIER